MSNHNPLIVSARMIAQNGKEDAARTALQSLLAPTRVEDGCIQYDMHESTDTPGTFFFFEIWESKAHLDAHLNTPHLQSFFGQAPDLFEGNPEITLWNKSD